MKTITSAIAVMLFGATAVAQQPAGADIAAPATYLTQVSIDHSPGSVSSPSPFGPPLAVQVFAGSQGVGADFKYGFLENLSARLGFGIVPVNAQRGFSFSAFPVNGQLAARFANIHLLADYSLFDSRIIRLVGGAAYIVRGDANVLISSREGYQVGSRDLTKDQIGVITADVKWQGVAPYLGVSLFKPFPGRLFNVNMDIGTYYLSRPATSFTGTNLLTNNDDNARQFNENMKGYRWMPVVQFNFNFRIK